MRPRLRQLGEGSVSNKQEIEMLRGLDRLAEIPERSDQLIDINEARSLGVNVPIINVPSDKMPFHEIDERIFVLACAAQ